MSRLRQLSVAWLPGCVTLGLVMAAAASQALAAEPPSAMLGVIPVDRVGQVFVKDVFVGSPAHAAGLRAGDRILEVDDKAVLNAADLIGIIGEYQPNTRVEIHASRAGWVKRVSITLAKRGDVERQPLSSVAERPPVVPQGAVAPPQRGLSAEQVRIMNDPYYRAKKSRW